MVLAAALPGTERARRRIEPVLPPPGLEVLPPSPGAEPRAPIVLLPALGFAGRSLLPVARALDGRRLRALVDPPGIEGGPPLPSIDADALLDGLAGAIDRLDAGPVVLAGHSIGGAIAVRLAARRPERVAALVLIDAPVSPFPLSWWERLALHPATWVALLDLLGPVLAVRLALPDVLG